jgi:hypothetical protein
MKKIAITSIISLSLIGTSVHAFESSSKILAEEIQESFKEVIEEQKLEKQEFKPIIFDDVNKSFTQKKKEKQDESKQKTISIRNEFFQSIKVSLKSANDTKILYLNPYEKLDDIAINRADNYSIKIYDLNDKYLGNLIRVNLKEADLVQVSPFLIFPELINKEEISETKTKVNDEKAAIDKTAKIDTSLAEIANPKEVVIEDVEKIVAKQIEAEKAEEGNQFKIANLSDYRVKVSIKKSNGESIGTNWTIENDVYSPELLKFASKPVVLEPDTNINITYLDKDNQIKKELSLPAKLIPKDHNNNYTYFIENIASE